MPLNENSPNDSTVGPVIRDRRTVVIPAGVDEIADDALVDYGRLDRLYIKEGACIECLPCSAIWDCVKFPQSQADDFFESNEPWKIITNGFFSGAEVQQPEFAFKKCGDKCVRWIELKPREFKYICSLAFGLPREECEEVGGRWLFTRSPKSGNLLLQLASAFMDGAEVEQDFPMALRCCEQACWCAIRDEIPFAPGESFPGVEVGVVDQSPDSEIYGEYADLFERAKGLKEEVLTHFQRLDMRRFARVGEGDNIRYCITPDNAFEGQDDLRDVLLPDELCDKHVHIGCRAFAECPNLRSISVQDVTDRFRLSRCADSFEGCHSLTDRIQYSLDGTTLLYCFRFDPPRGDATPKFIVCDHVRSIADFAFQHFDGGGGLKFLWGAIDDVDVKDFEVRKVGAMAFEGCQQLHWVTLRGREFALGARAFMNCAWLHACEFGVFRDVEEEMPGIESPISYLDVSAQSVFEGCENMLCIKSITSRRGFLVVNNNTSGAQFVRCGSLSDIPPIIATHIPQFMFESCDMLSEVKCVAADPDVIKAVVSGWRPVVNLAEKVFGISTMAFAHCRSLGRFKFCRLRVSFKSGCAPVVELIDDNHRQVLFGYKAFLDCSRLSRIESSFASAVDGSDLTAFSGCPEFEGFLDDNG